MVKILEKKGSREAIVGYRKLNLTTYSLGVNTESLVTPKEVKREVCKLCYLGDSKAKGRYNNLKEKEKCDDCATNINIKHDKAKKERRELVVEIETPKVISSALTAFSRFYDQPTIKGFEDF